MSDIGIESLQLLVGSVQAGQQSVDLLDKGLQFTGLARSIQPLPQVIGGQALGLHDEGADRGQTQADQDETACRNQQRADQ